MNDGYEQEFRRLTPAEAADARCWTDEAFKLEAAGKLGAARELQSKVRDLYHRPPKSRSGSQEGMWMGSPIWTMEEEQLMKHPKDEKGMTFSETAAELSRQTGIKRTRNACQGRYYRMKNKGELK